MYAMYTSWRISKRRTEGNATARGFVVKQIMCCRSARRRVSQSPRMTPCCCHTPTACPSLTRVDSARTTTGAAAMQSRPRVVFIHGVNGRKKRKKWLGPLNKSLRDAGVEAIDRAEVPDVRYDVIWQEAGTRRGDVRCPPTDAATKAAYAVNQDELRRVLREFRELVKSPLTRLPSRSVTTVHG